MTIWFALWDSESANLVGNYANVDAALAVVRSVSEPAEIMSLILTAGTDDGDEEVFASGSALLGLVQEHPLLGAETLETVIDISGNQFGQEMPMIILSSSSVATT